MKNFNTLFNLLILFLGSTFCTQAQLTVNYVNGQTVQEVLEDNFVGAGVTVSNATFKSNGTVNSNQFGTFTNADTTTPNIGLSEGLILFTGGISGATSVLYTGSPIFPEPANILSPHLTNILSPTATNNVAILEFDFVPLGTELTFNYVFSSMEYPQYVCSAYNDAFGFFIDGPYESDGVTPVVGAAVDYNWDNIAIIPGSMPEKPITINNVNAGSCGSSGNSGCVTSGGCSLDFSHLFVNGVSALSNSMSGYTIPLETKKVTTIPCKVYKIHIAICNASDQALPSAVFLEANSFKANNAKFIQDNKTSLAIGDTIIACSATDQIAMTIESSETLLTNKDYTLDIITDMVSGTDYSPFSSIISFNAGDDSKSFDIDFNNTSYAPGQVKTMKIILHDKSLCGTSTAIDSVTIHMKKPDVFTFSPIADYSLCKSSLPQTLPFTFNTKNGVETLLYEWSAGTSPTLQSNSIVVNNAMTIDVKATDACGRIVTDQFKITPKEILTSDTIYATICSGATYTGYGFAENATGIYSKITKTTEGCDSTYYLNLTVNLPKDTTLNDSICQYETYTKNGFNEGPLNITGNFSYKLDLTTAAGCDSTVYLNLTVNPVKDTILYGDVYQGYSYTDHGFDYTYNIPGIYTIPHNEKTNKGCDSIVVLELTVKPLKTTTLYDTICVGNIYTDNGFSLPVQTLSDIHEMMLLASDGVDSLVILNLAVMPVEFITFDDHICINNPYTKKGFNLPVQTTEGLFVEQLHLLTQYGCDSTVTVNLSVHPTKETILYDEICFNEPYYNSGFYIPTHYATGTDTHKLNLTTKWGCDSTVYLNLTVKPIDQTIMYDTVYIYEPYTISGFHIPTQHIPGNFEHILVLNNELGCDSTIILKLFVEDCPIGPATFFSPNGDGENDVWTIENAECGISDIDIYDRYGRLLARYENSSFKYWDGKHEEKVLSSDDYWYLAILKSGKRLVGHFSLIR